MPTSIYPTGTTIYDPEQSWSGYTIFQARDVGATLIDMNGNVVNQWKDLMGFPNRILPGGYVFGSTGVRNPKYGFQDQLDLVQVDWDGNIVWKFNKYERVKDPHQKPTWMARQHHDYQREGNSVGYYVPGMDPLVAEGNTLVLAHKNLKNPLISDKLLLDDTIIEVDWDGNILWEWTCSEHFEEMDFSEDAKNTIARNPNFLKVGVGMGDWMHMNSMSTLGPNRWFDAGDERFHPDNIIFCGRMTNIIAIISKNTSEIVWQMGPTYTATPELRKMGQLIGQHHAHLIPQGLPGAGNILVFDNGGWAGYGSPNPGSPTGTRNALRDYSRVLEFDPISLEIVWQYSAKEAGFTVPVNGSEFYSSFVSSAQRLPNGNTLITEGAGGRLFEVTPEHEIVWEYMSPFYGKKGNQHTVYRSYRVPYRWVPQVDRPEETPVARLDVTKFRVPGSVSRRPVKVTATKGAKRIQFSPQDCVLPREED